MPPVLPGDADIAPNTCPEIPASQGTPLTGRLIQSRAFFNTAGSEVLYSGVEMSSASASMNSCFKVIA